MINANLSAFSVGKAVGRGGGPKSWQYSGTSFSVSQATIPTGITWDGTNFWVLDRDSKNVYKYTSTGTYTGTSFSVNGQEPDPYGITWDGANLWVAGYTNDRAYKYSLLPTP